MKSNLKVASNVWICAADPHGPDNNVWRACLHMPGDLRVSMADIATRNRAEIDRAMGQGLMTKAQYQEFLAYRFFLPHTHETTDLVVSLS
jgi:hypothetical protein